MKLNKQPLNPNKVYEVQDGGLEGLDYVKLSDLESGLLATLDDQGFIPLENIDFSTFGYEPALQGVKEIILGTPENYRITNYSSFRNYTLKFTGGEVIRNGDTITITSIRDGVQILTVNGYNFKIDVKKGSVDSPSVIKVSHKIQNEFYDITAAVTPFKAFPLPESQLSLEVQVFADVRATLLLNSYEHFGSNINETIVRVTRKFSTVYIRARYAGVNYGKGEWSSLSSYSFPVVFSGVSANEQRGSCVDVSSEGDRFVVGSPNPEGGSGTSGSISVYRKAGVDGSRYIHGPDSVELIIPEGGSIRIVLDSEVPYDKTFTTSQFVNLPAWATGEAIGTGGPGSVIVIPEVVSKPEIGNSLYPNGLPVFVPPKGPIFEQKTREVYVPPTRKEERILETTLYPINKGLCCYLTEAAAQEAAEEEAKDYVEGKETLAVVNFTPKTPPADSIFFSYEKITKKTFTVNTEADGQFSVGVLVSEEYYSVYGVIDKPGEYIQEVYDDVVGYLEPAIGEPAFPDGLPPYEEEVIGYPESYKDVRGPSSFIKLADGVISFEGGLGNTSAAKKSVYLFTKTLSTDNSNAAPTKDTLVKLTIPTGGSVRIVTEASPQTSVFDKTYTNTENVILPPWVGSLTFIGKGSMGGKVWVEPKPATPEVGNSQYPNGLPSYSPAIVSYTGTLKTGDNFSFNVSWNAPEGSSNFSYQTSYDPTYLGFNVTSAVISNYPTTTGSFSTSVNIKYFDTNANTNREVSLTTTGFIGGSVSIAQQGLPEFPNGLPAYQPAKPEVSGFFQDTMGASSSVLVDKKTLVFEGSLGEVPVVEKTLVISAATSVVFNNYVLEKTFSHINQPTTVNLSIASGGSIQLKTTGNSTVSSYDRTFTTSQSVIVPGWVGNLTIIGKGGPGTKTWIEGTAGTPQQGNPSYPSGLPSYSPASGPIYRTEQTQVWVPPVYYKYWKETSRRETTEYRDTPHPEVGYRSGYGSVILPNASLEDPNTNNWPVGMSGWAESRWSKGTTVVNGVTKLVYGYVYATYVCAYSDRVKTAGYYTYQPTSVFVGYTYPQVGNPSYPTGLPPYVPATPPTPGYYRDTTGAVSTYSVGGLTGSFAGGSGDTPAVLTTAQITIGEKDGFGTSVAISHNSNNLCIISGSPNDTYNAFDKAGGCFYTKLVNGEWADLSYFQIQTPVANANFGYAVDISADGSYAFISAPGENKVYVYKNFILDKVLSPSSMIGKTRFGSTISCSADGNILAVGYATGNTISLFKKNSSDVWSETVISGAVNTYRMFGKVAPNGYVKIEQLNATNQVIKTKLLNGGSFDTSDWGLEPSARKLRITGSGGSDTSLGILGAVGSEGETIYPPGTWGFTDPFGINQNMEMVPYLSGTTISDSTLNYMSRNFVFKYEPNNAPPEYIIDINANSEGFGSSLSLSGNGKVLAVGVFNTTNTEGHVRVIDLATNKVTFVNPRTPITNGYFGKSVSISHFADRLLITEPGRKNNLGGRDVVILDDSLYVTNRLERESTSSPVSGSFGVSASLSQRGSFNVIGEPKAFNNLGQLHINAD